MLANKRHSIIIDLIKEKGAVSVTEICEKTAVSAETVRRDLLLLEKKNLLERVHGGAIAIGEMMYYHDLSVRKEESVCEKIELCKTAEQFVCDGDIIFIDSGSTPVYFAKEVKNKNITVITCSIDVFSELKGGNCKVILCGGQYFDSVASFCGGLTLDTVKKLSVNKAFIFPSAISLRHGICDFSLELYPIEKEIIEKADKVYVLATGNKFEKNGLLKICDMNENFIYVTDSSIKKEYKQAYEKNGIKIIDNKERLC